MGRRKFKKKIPLVIKKTPSPKHSPGRTSLKVTGLNDKCLKKICSYLEIDELANLAASCKRFIPICTELFEFQYSKMHYPIRVYEIHNEDKFERYENMLIYFGKYIRNLRVEYDSPDRRANKEMHELIVEHCSGTLTQLHCFQMEKRMAIHRSFWRLTHLTLTQSHLNATISHFEKWCPNLRSLELEMVQSITNTSCIERPLPMLEHFALVNFIDCNFSNKSVRRFIKNNPQLKELRICSDIFGMALKITTEYISYIDQMLPNLETLDLLYTQRSAPQQCAHLSENPPKFQNLKCLRMTCRSADTLTAFMIPNKSIEKLNLDIDHGANEKTLEYIMNSDKLKSLNWCLNKEDELKYLFKLSKNPIPALNVLKLYVIYGLRDNYYRRCQVLVNIIDFMVHHKQLNSIVIGFQMTDHNSKLLKAEIGCCDDCSKKFDVDHESSDDDAAEDGDEEIEESTPAKNSDKVGSILYPFVNFVEQKFKGIWEAKFYMHKKPNKLIPVMEDLFVCIAFKKNIIN